MALKRKYSDIIKKSQERSRAYGVEKDKVSPSRILSPRQVKSMVEKHKDLISIAHPFLDELYEIVEGTGFIIILTDKEGCILEIRGDNETLNAAIGLDMVVGAYMDEKSVGTNAMGTALSENAPIQVSATEHFITAYHRWTCSAAPIHNEKGEIIGTLNLTANKDKVHPHTLGMVVSVVKAIEFFIQNKTTQEKLLETYQYVFTIMNTLSFGVIAVNLDGKIQWINDTACNIFNIRRTMLLNRHISNYIKDWNFILRKLNSQDKVVDEEVVFQLKEKTGTYSLNTFPIKTPKQLLTGFLITFREMQKVLSMVNKYMGMQARFTFRDIIGDSAIMREMKKHARSVAKSPSTVLITGESGTGKELFAQSIHNESNRAENGFVAVNCGAISESLMESELFGYEEGAFTGAKKKGKKGKFELASYGTLFLDEIGEMNPEMQVKLLRAIQEGKIVRVGGEEEIPVDVRIIAATNKDLKKEVEKGTFRLDLYYRLNVIPIHIPPLRQRSDDIPQLLRFFLNRKASKLSKPVPRLSDELLEKLRNYEWLGNIRELENFVEKFINFGEKETFSNLTYFQESHPPQNKYYNQQDELLSLEESEKRAIETALKHFGNNISKAAEKLGITRSTLYTKMKKFNITHY